MKTIQKRKGFIRFDIDMHKIKSEQELKEIFSNFYPVAIEPSFKVTYWSNIKYYGLSPHFDEIEDGTEIPEYQIWLTKVDDTVVFEKMEKLG